MLIDVLQQEATKIDILVYVKKTVCMEFNPSQKPKIVSHEFKHFVLDGRKLEYVVMFKYLGHLMSSDLSDDADVKREIRYSLCMYVSILYVDVLVDVRNE